MKDKLFAFVLVLLMALSLVACGEQQDASNTSVPTTSATVSDKHLVLFEDSIAAFMDHIVTEVPRESWEEVMNEMPWSFRSINTFNTDDPGFHGDDSWAYYDGQFCVMADSWHFLQWSSNIECDVASDCSTYSLIDTSKDGYMLFLLGDYYFYLVEISSTRETHVTCLEDYTLDGFYTIWSMIAYRSSNFLKSWSATPIIDNCFLDVLYSYENMYSKLGEYAALIYNQEERKEALSYIENGYVGDPIQTFLYDHKYRNFVFAILDGGMWDMKYSYRYQDGAYSLGDGYYVTVEWSYNIHSDSVPDDFNNIRTYKVIDPTEDAFLLINGMETGYSLVRIVAQGNNSPQTPDSLPVYSFAEFERLYNNIEGNCDQYLAELAETGELTNDCLEYFRINSKDYEELYWYGEQLPAKEYAKFIQLKNGGWIDPPFIEVHTSSSAAGHLYSYGDYVFSLYAPYMEIVCSINIADIQWDPYERDVRNFFIEDPSKPAYIEVLGEGGYTLFYFNAG